jgi:DNA-binding NtrC family response regulator
MRSHCAFWQNPSSRIEAIQRCQPAP